MKRLLEVFVLTPREQRLVVFIMLALVLGAWIKHQRESQLYDPTRWTPVDMSFQSASPTPNAREPGFP